MGLQLLRAMMSFFETRDKTTNHAPGAFDNAASELVAEAHSWFSHQSSTAKTLEIACAMALGTAALALTNGRLHAVELVAKSAHLDGALTEIERQTAFAAKEYLSERYLVSPALNETMNKLSGHLAQNYPEFNSIVVVGGQSNGSFVLRSMTKKNPGSDLDFYFIGHATTAQRLSEMSQEVKNAIKPNKLTLDGFFNGKNPELYLNLSGLQQHIDNADFNLMALPFRAAYGRPTEAKLDVLRAVLNHPQKDEVWQGIVNMHAETLSMHHGTWTLDFNNAIMHDYLPQKVQKFGLPETPELALKLLTERSVSE